MDQQSKTVLFLLATLAIIFSAEGQSNRGRSPSGSSDRRAGTGGRAHIRCYICSGKFPDRDCELYPQYVTMGPGKLNCSRDYCSTIVRYKPKKYLLTLSPDKKLTGTIRPLTPQDFDVDSIARECEDLARGNKCEMDPDDLGITCYSMCNTDLCNKDVPSPKKYSFRKSPRATTRSMADTTTVPEPDVRRSPEAPLKMGNEIPLGVAPEANLTRNMNENEKGFNETDVEQSGKNGEKLDDENKLEENEIGDKEGMRQGETNGVSATVYSQFLIQLPLSLIITFIIQGHSGVNL